MLWVDVLHADFHFFITLHALDPKPTFCHDFTMILLDICSRSSKNLKRSEKYYSHIISELWTKHPKENSPTNPFATVTILPPRLSRKENACKTGWRLAPLFAQAWNHTNRNKWLVRSHLKVCERGPQGGALRESPQGHGQDFGRRSRAT